jgi:copper chaperone CopZ
MKKMNKIIALIIMMIVPLTINAQEKSKANVTVKYKTSIDCADCVNKIMTNLPHEKGIKDVKCDLATKEITVTYQLEKNNPEEIKKSIEKLGYTAKVIPAENVQEQKK